MSVAVDDSTRVKIRQIIEWIAEHNHAAAEEHLTSLLASIADGSARVSKKAMVRFELSCRGCSKELIKLTQEAEVIAGQNAPTLVYSGGLDPHDCPRRKPQSEQYSVRKTLF